MALQRGEGTRYYAAMETVPIEQLHGMINELVQRVEQGETVTFTRDGKPVADLVPHVGKPETPESVKPKSKGGLNYEWLEEFKKERGIDRIVTYIDPNFDDPLPEDFLLRPLPDPVARPKPK